MFLSLETGLLFQTPCLQSLLPKMLGWVGEVRERNYELYGENLQRAVNGKKRDVSSGKKKAQSNGGKDGKDTEQCIICRQKRWEMNKWNIKKKAWSFSWKVHHKSLPCVTSYPVVLEYPDIQLFAWVQQKLSQSQGTGSEQGLHTAAHARPAAHTLLDLVTLTPGAAAGTSL